MSRSRHWLIAALLGIFVALLAMNWTIKKTPGFLMDRATDRLAGLGGWNAMAFQSLVFVAIMLAAALRLDLLGTSVLVAAVQVGIYIASADYMRRKLPEFFPWWRAPDWRRRRAPGRCRAWP